MIHHLVLLKVPKNVSRAQVDKVFAELAGLKKKIPGILSFAGGAYSSPEGFNKGYTHGFAMTFGNAQARDAYLTHPEHEKVKASVIAILDHGLEGGVAFDFEA